MIVLQNTSVVDVDREDQLQRFGRVKIEATSFTVSEPHKPLMISPLILNYVSNDENITLSNSYDVEPFQIETIKLERIFIDKIFAAEFYYLRQDYFNTSKHIYDVVTLLQNAEILDMLSDQERVDYLVHLQRMEELERKGSALSEVPISEFSFIHTAIGDEALRREFSRMQNIYVLVDQYQISLKEFINGISALHDIFQSGKFRQQSGNSKTNLPTNLFPVDRQDDMGVFKANCNNLSLSAHPSYNILETPQ